MDIKTERFWLHPVTLGAIIGGVILFVAFGGNVELLWIAGAVAIGFALASDRTRVHVSGDCVCGTHDEVTTTRAERQELVPTVGHLPRRPARTREREVIGTRSAAGSARARERSTDERRRRP